MTRFLLDSNNAGDYIDRRHGVFDRAGVEVAKGNRVGIGVPVLAARGITEIDTREIERPLKKWVATGKTSGEWSEPTILRIAQGLLSALRDFGVLQGAAKKRIAPAYLPVTAFAYWEELLEGKYEWSSIGKQLRQKGLVE
jgi:hypothetical protein